MTTSSRWLARFQQKGTFYSGVISAHQLSAGIGALIGDVAVVISCCTAAELANRVTYLPLKRTMTAASAESLPVAVVSHLPRNRRGTWNATPETGILLKYQLPNEV